MCATGDAGPNSPNPRCQDFGSNTRFVTKFSKVNGDCSIIPNRLVSLEYIHRLDLSPLSKVILVGLTMKLVWAMAISHGSLIYADPWNFFVLELSYLGNN